MEDVDEKERINQEQIAQNQHFAMDLTRKLEGLSQATFEIGDVEYQMDSYEEGVQEEIEEIWNECQEELEKEADKRRNELEELMESETNEKFERLAEMKAEYNVMIMSS